MPAADQKNVAHCVAMIASVVRVIKNDSPVRYEDGPNSSTAASVRVAEDPRLVGRWLLLLQADEHAALARLGVPEAAEQVALRRGGDQLELVGQQPAAAIGGQCGEPSVRVEDRGQRQHLRDRLGVGHRMPPDPLLDPLQLGEVLAADDRPYSGTTRSTTPIPPSRDSTA